LPESIRSGLGCGKFRSARERFDNEENVLPQENNGLTLGPAVDAPRREFTGKAGRLSYYVAGEGPPLLLIHSINAAGSVYEVRPIFEEMRKSHQVYAVDLPGFGFSDRSDRDYTPRLYTDAVHDMLELIAKEHGATPVDALAVSLGSEFLARAAVEAPERFRTLALVSATGFSKRSGHFGRKRKTREVPGLYAFFTFPLWSDAIFKGLTSERSIRFFLRKTFGSDDYDRGLLAYDYLTTHQPGAKNAPYAFVSGRLFSADIHDLYAQIKQTVWMPHGTKGDFGDFSGAGWARGQANWTVEPYDTGALPHFEQPAAFLESYREFLRAG
jgi:pimeloyl-ACP methyl ester carboxylesterase